MRRGLGYQILTDTFMIFSCARCGCAMQLIRSIPPLRELPELRVFVCPSCGDVETKPIPANQADREVIE
jgi:predicted RNA-binding Zn-ribbon protein involved in translation (DUF1610 family)